MGFDLTRFVGEVDEELCCTICTMVLENPMQLPCDHTFCNDCINAWLTVNGICPVDRGLQSIADLKPPARIVRNLLDKLEIRCDFHQRGCTAIVKVDSLKNHLSGCQFNPTSEIICDKGCNMKICRSEYETDNCFAHLSNRVKRQDDEIVKQHHELSDQKEQFEFALNRQQDQITKLTGELSDQKKQSELVSNRQGDQIVKLTGELSDQKEQSELVSNRQRDQIAKLTDEVNRLRPSIAVIPAKRSVKWHELKNLKISAEHPNVLDHITGGIFGTARSFYALDPENPSAKIEILKNDVGYIWFGLCRKGESSFYDCNIFTTNSETLTYWRIGDIIECGIKFPQNFTKDGSHDLTVYFLRNQELIKETVVKSRGELFPTIELKNAKVKYLTD